MRDLVCQVNVMTAPIPPRQRIQLQFDVADETQARELGAAWEEIVSGKRTRLATAAEDVNEIMERARVALQVIVKAIEEHPGTGQSGRLVRFLAGVYNGHEFHFDLTDLRALDTELANACIDYLNYDRLAKAEVHTHLPGGGKQMQGFIAQKGILPRLRLSSDDEHASRLFALAQRLDRERDALLKEALEDLLSQYESKAYGALMATQKSADGDGPLVHARLLSESVAKPLCGADDGPWSARLFEFTRLTCSDCKSLVLHPDDDDDPS
jgi:hypothetical protein